MSNLKTRLTRGLVTLCFPATLMTASFAAQAEEEAADVSFDNLQRVEESRIQVAYIDPAADFSVFGRVAILEPYVAFRSNWQREQNRSRTRNVTSRDMERIRADVATLFERVFTDRLEAAGYEVVTVAGDDVLVLRPAIIDLDITAPDTRNPGRTRTFTATTGAATLFVELVDSVTGSTIGRGVDRRTIRSPGNNLSWSNSVTNTADANRMLGRWADQLVAFLDEHYKPEKAE